METLPPIVWVLGGLAVLLVLTRLALNRTRRQLLMNFAAIRKWQFKPSARNLDREFGDVAPFNRGTKRRSTMILVFKIGETSGLSLDYSYADDAGGEPVRERFHVVGVNLPREVETITLTRAAGAVPGAKPREWDVQTESAKYRRRIMNPKLVAWLDSPENTADNFTISRSVIFTYASGRQDIDRVDEMVAALGGFAEQLPASLWQDGAAAG